MIHLDDWKCSTSFFIGECVLSKCVMDIGMLLMMRQIPIKKKIKKNDIVQKYGGSKIVDGGGGGGFNPTKQRQLAIQDIRMERENYYGPKTDKIEHSSRE